MAIPTVFTVLWCAGTVWSTVGALSGHCGALCCHVVLHKFVGPPLFAWRSPVSGTVDGQNPAPPHHFTLEGSHSNPRAPSFNVGATPLRRWCRILDLQLGGAGFWTFNLFLFSHCGGHNVNEGERGQQEKCAQSGAGFCPSTVSFHYYSLVSVVLLYQACCVSFLRLLAG